jgi:hypothetical protein
MAAFKQNTSNVANMVRGRITSGIEKDAADISLEFHPRFSLLDIGIECIFHSSHIRHTLESTINLY